MLKMEILTAQSFFFKILLFQGNLNSILLAKIKFNRIQKNQKLCITMHCYLITASGVTKHCGIFMMGK